MGALAIHKVNTTERLAYLRALMKKEDVNVQAYVVPSEDQRTPLLNISKCSVNKKTLFLLPRF